MQVRKLTRKQIDILRKRKIDPHDYYFLKETTGKYIFIHKVNNKKLEVDKNA